MVENRKKGQEEMVGFVLIVVIVTIAIMVLLIFSLRRPAVVESSLNIENFIQAIGYFTTDCEIAGQLLSLKKVIVSCQNNEQCENGKSACEVLNETIKNLITAAWESSGFYKGYDLKIYAISSEDENATTVILQKKEGNLTGSYEGGDLLFPIPPNRYHIYLKVYA
ncbi:MAG: hypothetical protein QXF25_02130 [Candidatus Pacearchaeota archaeon]